MTQESPEAAGRAGGVPGSGAGPAVELAGRATGLAGRGFATVFKAIKTIRPVRPIHPRGISLVGELTRHGLQGGAASRIPGGGMPGGSGMPGGRSGISWLDAPGTDQVQARFSRSVGLPDALPDILGLALRIGGATGSGSSASGSDATGTADVLFASTGWGVPARFLLLPRLDVGAARFTTLMPYRGADGPVLLGLRTLSLPPRATGRAETRGDFRAALAEGDWVLALSYATPAGPWVHAGTLRLRSDPDRDDTPDRFDPLQHPVQGAGTYAWARRLRESSYRTARGPAPGLPGVQSLTAGVFRPRVLTPRLLTTRRSGRRRADPSSIPEHPAPHERKPMATITQVYNSPAADVWKVIADGWLYSGWVVGASRIRAVDARWPELGSRLYHSVGAWPLVIDDSTRVAAVEPGKSLELTARGWPMGEAKVVITLEDMGTQCRVTIAEDAVRGPGLAVPKVLRDALISIRNRETLKRLELMAAGGAGD
ncbi:SRPBCC domain-containing protein [Arthrobacter sp. NPDC093139]|uniref:SRPBCC family protein n=1 Tax=Arthrobacter sp. NPDC093139 TaxID=3363945 RepID=UPI00382FA1BA